jgi:hypothetical protein
MPTKPCYAKAKRGDNWGVQDECLITPVLDFSGYKKIYLQFLWYSNRYTARGIDVIDFNVSISIDGGKNWIVIWTDNSLNYNLFSSYVWHDTTFNNHIDLSEYCGNSSVLIGFQYYSDGWGVGSEPQAQVVGIDNVLVYTPEGDPFKCSAGGPYDWWWDRQHDYNPPGVRFHGDVVGADWWTCEWIWDFGDGEYLNTSFRNVHHFYEYCGVYNVRLTVIDKSSEPWLVNWSNTTVLIFEPPPPELEIELKTPSIGVKAEIKNMGIYNYTRLNWTIMIDWGPEQKFGIQLINDTIECLVPTNSEIIICRRYFIAFGKIHVTIKTEPENMPLNDFHFYAYKIGPFVFGAQS